METPGMALYRLSCGELAKRGYFNPAWDALSDDDKKHWDETARSFLKWAMGDPTQAPF